MAVCRGGSTGWSEQAASSSDATIHKASNQRFPGLVLIMVFLSIARIQGISSFCAIPERRKKWLEKREEFPETILPGTSVFWELPKARVAGQSQAGCLHTTEPGQVRPKSRVL